MWKVGERARGARRVNRDLWLTGLGDGGISRICHLLKVGEVPRSLLLFPYLRVIAVGIWNLKSLPPEAKQKPH